MNDLPPGQKESKIFPRFGLPQYANRFPSELDTIRFIISGDIDEFEISDQLLTLERKTIVSDFHCVTTWSKLNLKWSGYRFSDFYNALILPRISNPITFVVLKAQDGYKTSLPLSDLMNQNVLLADYLNDAPLNVEHGAPIRIVAPDHYGYKNLKHLKGMEFYSSTKKIKQGYLSFMDHPRARVSHEERASYGPAILFRWIYKIGIKNTISSYKKATNSYRLKMKVNNHKKI